MEVFRRVNSFQKGIISFRAARQAFITKEKKPLHWVKTQQWWKHRKIPSKIQFHEQSSLTKNFQSTKVLKVTETIPPFNHHPTFPCFPLLPARIGVWTSQSDQGSEPFDVWPSCGTLCQYGSPWSSWYWSAYHSVSHKKSIASEDAVPSSSFRSNEKESGEHDHQLEK